MIYCCLDIFSQPVTIQFSLILLATRMLLGPFNNKRTIWENTERSRDAEIFKKKYQSCNKYIYIYTTTTPDTTLSAHTTLSLRSSSSYLSALLQCIHLIFNIHVLHLQFIIYSSLRKLPHCFCG